MVVDLTGNIVPNFAVEIRQPSPATPSFSAEAQPSPLRILTDKTGQFSVMLPPGSYQVCIHRYPKSCRGVVVESAMVLPEYLTLTLDRHDEVFDLDLPEGRFRALAGPDAENCGSVKVNEPRSPATACANRAFKRHHAFFVVYYEHGIDSIVARGIASNPNRKLYAVSYDSMGMDTDHLRPGETMPDGFHTFVIPCSEPIRVHVSRTGQLTCRAYGRWLETAD